MIRPHRRRPSSDAPARMGRAGEPLALMARSATLWSAWARVAAGSGMAGADGLTVTDFAAQLGTRLGRLADQLQGHSYRPQPLRLVTMRRGGRRRVLGLPTI